MTDEIEFYFDFSSPYGYLASTQIDKLAERRRVKILWRPFLLGVVFKITGTVPLVDVPLKGEYSRHDISRSARLLGVPFRFPDKFPFGTTTACRAFYAVERDDPAAAVRLAKALFQAAFGAGRDIAAVESVIAVAAEAGFDPATIEAGIHDGEAKRRTREIVDTAIQKGVFGSPMFIVGNESFWGADRIPHLEKWLETGGW